MSGFHKFQSATRYHTWTISFNSRDYTIQLLVKASFRINEIQFGYSSCCRSYCRKLQTEFFAKRNRIFATSRASASCKPWSSLFDSIVSSGSTNAVAPDEEYPCATP